MGKGNQGVYKDFVRYIGLCDRTPNLKQHVEYLTVLVTSLNTSQPGNHFNTNSNTTTKRSARKIDFKKGGTTGTAGLAKDDGLTCYNSVQVGQMSSNCPNRDMMKKLLEQALVWNDAPKVESGRPRKDKKRWGAPASRKERRWLAKKRQAREQTDHEGESELKNLSDSDSAVWKGQGCQ